MKRNVFFSISDFARFSRTTRDTLLHYDRIGLLSPVSRGENKYRYYSIGQLASVNVIHTLQALGMTLEEIKTLKDHRDPNIVKCTFTRLISKIDKKIEEWKRAKQLLLTYEKSIHSALNADEKAITIQYIPAEIQSPRITVFLSPISFNRAIGCSLAL